MARQATFPILLAAMLAEATSCTPTVRVATDEPIVLNLNIRVEQEVRIRLDREVEELIGAEQSRLSTRSADPSPAIADSLSVSKARKQRRIGERADGYLGVVGAQSGSAGSDMQALVARVNERRRRDYEALAEQYGVAPSDVAAIAGARRVELAEPGELVLGADGRWAHP